ncbi:fibronectin type III domain-containing protein [Arhodomonas aquaeolei]|uniref:fibronectin type III domain-containing protein n=1 Tax=Arhodomonas aquaeolei TaxID=2369 RepID=UPI0003703402|nr:fibronectin type III domain-containing protein [Arhodomonas aquaeolei]
MSRTLRVCRSAALVLGVSLFLTACGGGGGGGSSSSSDSPPAAPVTGDAAITISWQAPTEREDGSALSMSQLAGYRVYYGTSPGDYSQEVDISDPYQQSYTIEGLSSGSYYIALQAYDDSNRLSAMSDPVSVQIN